jgi:transcriptional regulator with XRE-family HTH domain
MQQPMTPHARLRQARLRADLSQAALAELLEIHQTLVSKIETEERNPGRRVATKIRAFAGIDIEEWP